MSEFFSNNAGILDPRILIFRKSDSIRIYLAGNKYHGNAFCADLVHRVYRVKLIYPCNCVLCSNYQAVSTLASVDQS